MRNYLPIRSFLLLLCVICLLACSPGEIDPTPSPVTLQATATPLPSAPTGANADTRPCPWMKADTVHH